MHRLKRTSCLTSTTNRKARRGSFCASVPPPTADSGAWVVIFSPTPRQTLSAWAPFPIPCISIHRFWATHCRRTACSPREEESSVGFGSQPGWPGVGFSLPSWWTYLYLPMYLCVLISQCSCVFACMQLILCPSSGWPLAGFEAI